MDLAWLQAAACLGMSDMMVASPEAHPTYNTVHTEAKKICDRCDYTIDRIRTVRTESLRYIRNGYPERNLLLVKGSLPGARNALIFVRKV